MTPTEYKTLRKALGSQRASSKRLGIGFRSLQRVEAGEYGDPIPVKFENMLNGLSPKQGQPA